MNWQLSKKLQQVKDPTENAEQADMYNNKMSVYEQNNNIRRW